MYVCLLTVIKQLQKHTYAIVMKYTYVYAQLFKDQLYKRVIDDLSKNTLTAAYLT